MTFKVIDPKLRAVSGEYERQQAEYLEELEAGVGSLSREADHG